MYGSHVHVPTSWPLRYTLALLFLQLKNLGEVPTVLQFDCSSSSGGAALLSWRGSREKKNWSHEKTSFTAKSFTGKVLRRLSAMRQCAAPCDVPVLITALFCNGPLGLKLSELSGSYDCFKRAVQHRTCIGRLLPDVLQHMAHVRSKQIELPRQGCIYDL